jgi:Xaa-Pro dipeptidase
VPPTTSIDSSVRSEAAEKRAAALSAARAAGFDAAVLSTPANVRWLMCGRGRPVDAASPSAAYTVVLSADTASVLFPDIETPRVLAEERPEELGLEPVPYPWFEGPAETLVTLLAGVPAAEDAALESRLLPERIALGEDERERYRAAGADAAGALAATLAALRPEDTETAVAARLALHARERGFFPPVVLVAGAERQKVHRHPLPTQEALGEHALLALTAERDGLYTSLTRIVSFGPPPAELAGLVQRVAEVDAAMLAAARSGRPLSDVFAAASTAYAERGFPGEWRRHHQGGITGYRGREVFATPHEDIELPESCAVAFNPSITGGAKSEDTALVGPDGIEILTRTPDLPELELDGSARPAVVQL